MTKFPEYEEADKTFLLKNMKMDPRDSTKGKGIARRQTLPVRFTQGDGLFSFSELVQRSVTSNIGTPMCRNTTHR
jgi:hypothetical protein